MNLPAALQREVEAAEAAVAQMQQNAIPVVRDLSQLPPSPPPPPAAPEPVATVPPAPPAPASNEPSWEEKYKRLHNQVAPLQSQLTRMQNEVQQMREQMARKPEPPAEPPKPSVSPKELEDFGAQMIEMVQNQARQVFTHMSHALLEQMQGVEARVAGLETKVTGVAEQTGVTQEQMFLQALAQAVPDYEAVNASDAWKGWLAEPDPVYGVARQAALDAAVSRYDTARVIAIFKAFKGLQAQPPAPPATNPLERQLTPNGQGASAPAPSPKVIWTQQAINQFYRAIQRGEYRGREAEAKRLEDDINLAYHEGRIKG